MIPIFAGIRQPLTEAHQTAEEGDGFVVQRGRESNANLRTQLGRILRRAGMKPWPKLFQNLRASARRDLLEAGFSPDTVNAWLGHSGRVANDHYNLGAIDQDFQRANAAVLQKVLHSPLLTVHQRPRTATRCP